MRERVSARAVVKAAVCAALPPSLAAAVASAGLEQGELVLGVVGAGWATRLRYSARGLKGAVAAALGVEVERVRIRVVPPPGGRTAAGRAPN